MKPSSEQVEIKFRELLEIIGRLRGPGGCPWDRSQNKDDIGGYLIEEAYEVLEALDGTSPDDLKEELGDLLFQILFLAQLAEEAEEFGMEEVLSAVGEKMVRRHPHVFGDAAVKNAAEVRVNWERIKRELENKDPKRSAVFAGIPRTLSTLAKAQRMTARASKVGFDWKDAAGVLKKMEEELAEFKAAMAVGNRKQMKEEAGDLLFTAVNLCRFAPVDAEAALRTSLGKFTRRFTHIERELAERGMTPADASLAEMDRLWNEAKKIKKKEHPERQ
jgi:tetrapyrrole methylase family protein/MazG family protein